MVKRILIAVDAHQQDPATLEMAAVLAARCDSELVALFIEDENLIHLANLPFASEVDRASGAERRLDSPQMDRILGAQIAQTRRALSQITQRLRVRYSLKVIRGEYFARAVTEASDMDVLFLIKTTGIFKARATPPSPPERPAAETGTIQDKYIAVLFDGTECSSRALLLAAELASQNRMQLMIGLLAQPGQNVEQLSGGINETLGDRFEDLKRDIHTVGDEIELFRQIDTVPCKLLVIPRDYVAHFKQIKEASIDPQRHSIVLVS